MPDGDEGEGDTAGGHEGDECVTGVFEGLGGEDAKVEKEHGFLVQEDGGLVGDLRAEEPLARRYQSKYTGRKREQYSGVEKSMKTAYAEGHFDLLVGKLCDVFAIPIGDG